MSFEAIERAMQPDKALLPAGRSRRPSSPNLRYHKPARIGSLQSQCSSTDGDMQAVPRSFARTRWKPCESCYGGDE